jgi:hypothetical protein
LVENMTKPKKPGVTPGSFTIEHVKLSVSAGTAAKPYLSDVTSCHGSWPFSFTIKNWFNQPSITAHDKVRCTKELSAHGTAVHGPPFRGQASDRATAPFDDLRARLRNRTGNLFITSEVLCQLS